MQLRKLALFHYFIFTLTDMQYFSLTAVIALQQLVNYAFAAPWPGYNSQSPRASIATESHNWPWPAPTWSSPSTSPTLAPSVSYNTYNATSTTASSPTSSENFACASVSSLVATATAAVPTIPASIAWDCLQSVPLNATAAVPWLESLKPYIAWQSTLAYLKNPPSGYLEPAVDVYGTLDEMIANVNNYANEYALEFDLYQLFQTTHDGHFRYLPTLMSGVLTFGRPIAVVSISADGYELPRPYVYSDILFSANTSSFEASAIETINGVDAVKYLEDLSQYGSLQDPDALYNNVMYSKYSRKPTPVQPETLLFEQSEMVSRLVIADAAYSTAPLSQLLLVFFV